MHEETIGFCQSGVLKGAEITQIQNSSAETVHCATAWLDVSQRICSSATYIDIIFAEPFDQPPKIMAVMTFAFPYTPCASGVKDADNHFITNITKYGFRLSGGASPGTAYCGGAHAGQAISRFNWVAIAKKL